MKLSLYLSFTLILLLSIDWWIKRCILSLKTADWNVTVTFFAELNMNLINECLNIINQQCQISMSWWIMWFLWLFKILRKMWRKMQQKKNANNSRALINLLDMPVIFNESSESNLWQNFFNQNMIFLVWSVKSRLNVKIMTESWYLKLAHADLKIIKYLSEAVIEAQLVSKIFIIIKYEICIISKVKQIISCHSVSHETRSYEWICWNLIYMITVYNHDHYISHMLCDQTLMNHVYMQKTLITSQLSIKWFIKYVK